MPEQIELPIVFQDIPEFDQTAECVVQLEAEVREDEVFYPVAVVTLPPNVSADQPMQPADELVIQSGKVATGKIATPGTAVASVKMLPISEDGTTSMERLTAAGFAAKKIIEVAAN